MNKVNRIQQKVQSDFLPHVSPKLHQRFLTGMQAFRLQRLISINANGRSTAQNRKTGESRTYRLTQDKRFLSLMPKLVIPFLNLGGKPVKLSLDFSTLGCLQIACLAVITGRGRAIPVWCKVYLTRPEIDSMIPILIGELDLFLPLIPDKENIVITMDRWFAAPRLLEYLAAQRVVFICRIRSNIHLTVPWEKHMIISEISNEETWCCYANLELRLVRSDWKEGIKGDEPWFLLTNSFDLSRRRVLNLYARRFEIEEFFKDLKWVQGYEWHQIKTRSVLEIILYFVALGWWLLKEVMWEKILKSRSRRIHPHQKLSFFRTSWECLQKIMWPDELRFVPL